MGWEAQCGADLRHLLHTIQHLPMGPRQAATNVAPLAALCNTRFVALPSQPAPSTHPSHSPPRPRHLHRSLTENNAKKYWQRSPVQLHSQTLGEVGSNSNSGRDAADHADEQQQRPASVNANIANELQNCQGIFTDLQTEIQHDSTSAPTPSRSIPDDAADEILTHHHSLANNVQQAAAVLYQEAEEGIRTSQDSKGDMVATSDKLDTSSNLDVRFFADTARHWRYQRFDLLMLAYVVCSVLISACCQLSAT
ncbi:TPA: hypothetical protein ACH3X1_003675 [Trebouxia sp. C0004]